eukprot:2016952-Pyramimonas_sp.AAC.1
MYEVPVDTLWDYERIRKGRREHEAAMAAMADPSATPTFAAMRKVLAPFAKGDGLSQQLLSTALNRCV